MLKTLKNTAKSVSSNPLLIRHYYPTEKSLTFKYIKYRVLLPFLKLHYKLFNYLFPKRPWTSPGSILFFDKSLKKDMVGLEYGSGRSTKYFAKKIKHLVSIEHNEEWFNIVKKQLLEGDIKNVDYFLFPKENFPVTEEDLDIYLNEFDEYESKRTFENYYSKINEYSDNFFDFVIIDGRARVRCGLNAMNKLKNGGIFVLDNSERKRYKPLHDALAAWDKVETTNGITNTTIWFKP